MRRIGGFLIAVLLAVCLAIHAAAATGAADVKEFASVAADGSCQVTVTAVLRLETMQEKWLFPIPGEAVNVTLNGSRVRAAKEGDIRQVDLSGVLKNVVGEFSISIGYTLRDVVKTSETGSRELQIPMLSGFAYPVEAMSFSVTLPGTVTGQPRFSSGYHQADIEKDMTYSVSGNTVTGSFQKALKDHETLTMRLAVEEEMFPRSVLEVRDAGWTDIAIAVCAGLALLYWLLFLRCVPPGRGHSTEPPEGYSAGEMGCILHNTGIELSTMVLTWAQMGYILIQVHKDNRVRLHKRMDMGNERGEWEQRCFKKLFGRRAWVETKGEAYAQLCATVSKHPGRVRELMHPRTGNPRVFRGLGAGMGLFWGISIGVTLGGDAVLAWLLIFLFAVAGTVGGWLVQEWASRLFSWNKRGLWRSLAVCGVMLAFSILAGRFGTGALTVVGLLLSGVLLAFGGRRTDLGRRAMGQVLNLRHYLCTVPRTELQRICASDPDYFFRMAPYALALGCLRRYARRFGKERLPGCPYLTSGMDAHMTPSEWAEIMLRAVDSMEERYRQLPMERLLGLIQSFRK